MIDFIFWKEIETTILEVFELKRQFYYPIQKKNLWERNKEQKRKCGKLQENFTKEFEKFS
jgi:hypothetical protein